MDQALQLVWSDDGQLQRSPYSLTPPLTPPLKHSFVGEIFRIALPRTTGSASPHLPFGLCIEPDRENVNARRLSWLAGRLAREAWTMTARLNYIWHELIKYRKTLLIWVYLSLKGKPKPSARWETRSFVTWMMMPVMERYCSTADLVDTSVDDHFARTGIKAEEVLPTANTAASKRMRCVTSTCRNFSDC